MRRCSLAAGLLAAVCFGATGSCTDAPTLDEDADEEPADDRADERSGGRGGAEAPSGKAGQGGADAETTRDAAPIPTAGRGGAGGGGGHGDGGRGGDAVPAKDAGAVGGASVPSGEGLAGHWRMDETTGQVVFDATKNGNNGSIHYDFSWTKDACPASFENQGAFEAGGDATKITWGSWSPPSMPQRTEVLGLPELGTPMTIMLWLRPKRVAVRQGLWLLFNDSGSRLLLDTSPSGQLKLSGGTLAVTADALTVGKWQHVAVALDGQQATLYLDGRPVGSGKGAAKRGRITEMTMGKIGSDPFGGTIDDARIYGRALSEAEIMEIARGK